MRAPWKPCRPWRSMGPSGSRGMARVAIGRDVGGLEQLLVAQAADGATLLVGREHALAEALLMEPLTGRAGDVLPARLGLHGLLDARAQVQEPRVVDGHLERQRLRIVADDVDGPDRQIAAGDGAAEREPRGVPPA